MEREGRGAIALVSVLFVVFFLAGISGPLEANAAFGISPPFLNASNLLKGSHYTQTIYLVQDQPDQDFKIQANLEISDRIKKWITINSGKPLVIPKGVRQFPVDISVDVPKDADLGIYHGTLTFVGVPDEKTGQVTLSLGVQLAINLTIGTGIVRDFKIPLIRFLDIEEGWAPRVLVKFDNAGNVPETLTSSNFELYDKWGSIRLAYIQQAKKLPEIPPFTVKEEVIEFPVDLHLGLGQYWGNVGFSQDDRLIAGQRGVFNVLKAGSLSNPLVVIFDHVKRNLSYYLAGLAVVVLGFIIFFKKKFLRRIFSK